MLTFNEMFALLSAIWSTWAGALTGVVGLALTILALWWPNLPHRRIFLVVSIIILLISPIYAWRDEYRDHTLTKQRFEKELKASAEPFKIFYHSLGSQTKRQKAGMAAHEFIVLTNRPITPVRLAVTCNGDIADVYSRLLGIGGLALGGPERISKAQYELTILSPTWVPMTPLLVVAYSNQELNCSFSQR